MMWTVSSITSIIRNTISSKGWCFSWSSNLTCYCISCTTTSRITTSLPSIIRFSPVSLTGNPSTSRSCYYIPRIVIVAKSSIKVNPLLLLFIITSPTLTIKYHKINKKTITNPVIRKKKIRISWIEILIFYIKTYQH